MKMKSTFKGGLKAVKRPGAMPVKAGAKPGKFPVKAPPFAKKK
jgi:hypothetical protein